MKREDVKREFSAAELRSMAAELDKEQAIKEDEERVRENRRQCREWVCGFFRRNRFYNYTVENLFYASSGFSQETIRSVCVELDADHLLKGDRVIHWRAAWAMGGQGGE